MAALDRPTHAFDGTPVAGTKRQANGVNGSEDPRSEGGPSRARHRLRAEFARRGGDDTGPIIAGPDVDSTTDAPPIDPDAADSPFDWVDSDTAVQAAVGNGAPAITALAGAEFTTGEIAVTEPVANRSGTVIDDRPMPPTASPTGLVPLVVTPATAPLPPTTSPVPQVVAKPIKRRTKPRVRRVRRVVRSIDTWTVFKLSLIFYLVMYAVLMVAGVLLWNLAYATGTIDNLENFFESFGWETFRFHGGQIFHSAWVAGLFLVAAGTGLHVVMATVFNLIADLVGGIGVTVLEEEVRVVPDTEVGRRRRAES